METKVLLLLVLLVGSAVFMATDARRRLPKACRTAQKIGPCRAAIPRYYYNRKLGKCLKFSWGGCQPNANNFETLRACLKKCKRRGRPSYRKV